MSKVHGIRRPEVDEGVDVQYRRRHGCENAAAFRRVVDNDADLCHFNISSYGGGMPLYTPFVVKSTEPCKVCGKYLQGWFEWQGTLVHP
jgi:hypothetical protein